jgi:hypothetical protein
LINKIYPLAAILITTSMAAQAEVSLSEAIHQQLSPFASGNDSNTLCGNLLDGDSVDQVLTGPLAELCSEQLTITQGYTLTSQGGSMGNVGSEFNYDRRKYWADKNRRNLGDRWSYFVSIDQLSSQQGNTELLDAFSASGQVFNLGLNYKILSDSNLGIILNRRSNSGEFDLGGDFTDAGNGAAGLLEIRLGEEGFLQLLAGKDHMTAERSRLASFVLFDDTNAILSVIGKPESNYSYTQTYAAALLGNNWQFGVTGLTPSLSFNWRQNDYGTHSETGNSGLEITTYDDRTEYLQGKVGVQASWSQSLQWGVWAPQIGMDVVREFKNKARSLEVSFTGDNRGKRFFYNTPPGDNQYLLLSAGSVFMFKNGWQLFFNIETISGYDTYNQNQASMGIRGEM